MEQHVAQRRGQLCQEAYQRILRSILSSRMAEQVSHDSLEPIGIPSDV